MRWEVERKTIMDIVSFEVLNEVAQAGSFSAAAHRLNYSVQRVANIVDGLEAWLGTQLFERTNKGVTLTLRGSELLVDAQRIMREVDYLQHKAVFLEGDQAASATLHIGVSAGSLFRRIASGRFAQDPPSVPLDVLFKFTSCAPGDGLLALDVGLVDAVLFEAFDGRCHLDRFKDMEIHQIAQVSLAAVVGKASELAARGVMSLNALRDQLLVSCTNDGLFKLSVIERCRRRGFVPAFLDEPALGEDDIWKRISRAQAATLVHPWPGCEQDYPLCSFIPLYPEPDLFLDLFMVCKKEKVHRGLLDLEAFLRREYGELPEKAVPFGNEDSAASES